MTKKVEKKCFYICPIGPEGSETRKRTDDIFDFIIKPVVANFPDYAEPVRADKLDQSGSITSQIIELLMDADMVIADLSGMNPNVFYELAIRHAVTKPFIQILNRDEKLPFDVADLRTVHFDETDLRSVHNAIENMVNQFKILELDPSKVVTPISRAIQMDKLESSPTDVDKNIGYILRTLEQLSNSVGAINERVFERNHLEHKLLKELNQTRKSRNYNATSRSLTNLSALSGLTIDSDNAD